jgi:hypothetical protein
MAAELDAQTALRLKTTRESLHGEFESIHPRERVDAILDDSIAQVRSDAGFDDYVPALAERLCRDRLKAAARTPGLVDRGVPEVARRVWSRSPRERGTSTGASATRAVRRWTR